MNKVSLFLAVATLVALSGCSLVANQIEHQVAPIALPDAQNALAMAQAAGDADAVACYADLVKHLQNDTTTHLPTINGALSALEAARVAALSSGVPVVPADVHRDCAVLVVDAQEMAAKLGLGAKVLTPKVVVVPKP